MSDTTPNPEEWRTVLGHPDYEVSNRGRVRSHKRRGGPHAMRTYTDQNGYEHIKLGSQGWFVHRLVAAAFIGLCPDGQEVDHINRVRNDNRVENLQYLTHRENMDRRVTPPLLTECSEGHPFSGDNLYVQDDGKRRCRTCASAHFAKHRTRPREQDCSIDGCTRPGAYERKTDNPLCEPHYQRHRRAIRRKASV